MYTYIYSKAPLILRPETERLRSPKKTRAARGQRICICVYINFYMHIYIRFTMQLLKVPLTSRPETQTLRSPEERPESRGRRKAPSTRRMKKRRQTLDHCCR